MNNFATLKTRYLEFTNATDNFTVNFNEPYILVGIIAPEGSEAANLDINNSNLKPYEHACRKFSNSDYKYAEVNINPVGPRTFKGLSVFGTPSLMSKFPVILCYITF